MSWHHHDNSERIGGQVNREDLGENQLDQSTQLDQSSQLDQSRVDQPEQVQFKIYLFISIHVYSGYCF